jgi:hypothetical protein
MTTFPPILIAAFVLAAAAHFAARPASAAGGDAGATVKVVAA